MDIWKKSISIEKINTIANSREKRSIHTMQYFSDAWNLVQQDLGIHILYALVIFIIMNVVGFLGNVLYAGWFIVAYMKRKNQAIEFNHFFKCFEHLGGLLLQTLLLFLMFGIPAFFLGITTFILADVMDSPIILMPFLIFIFILFFASFMFIFAPIFIVFADMGPWEAMKASFKTVKNNSSGFIGFFVMMIVMIILGVMTCGLLFLVILPVIQVATYFAYEDLFQPDISDETDDLLRHLV